MNDDEQEQQQEQRDLEVLLSYLLNRPLKQGEVIEALGISRQTFFNQKDAGTLTNPANLLSAARHFGLNPLELLMHYSYIDIEHVHEVWSNWPSHLERRVSPTILARKGGMITTTLMARGNGNGRGRKRAKQYFGPAI